MDLEAELGAYDAQHPAFAGHFPGNPIVPGVLLLDAALHALGLPGVQPQAPLRLDQVKFLGVVRPGEALTLRAREHGATLRVGLRHGERDVASATLALARR